MGDRARVSQELMAKRFLTWAYRMRHDENGYFPVWQNIWSSPGSLRQSLPIIDCSMETKIGHAAEERRNLDRCGQVDRPYDQDHRC